jgi:DNA-binding response OmpR family regulator
MSKGQGWLVLNRNRILVVDDDRDVVRGTRLRLDAAGYDTLVAFDGEEGVAMAVDRHPDAILLDIRMPRKNGLTALAELRAHQQTKNIPIIMLSACLIDQQASLDAGARFFLAKPYRARKLLEVLESALDERTAARRSQSSPAS